MVARTQVGLALVLGLAVLASTARAQFPDLIVSEIELDPSHPAPGQEVLVTVHARNLNNFGPGDQTVVMYFWFDSPTLPKDACSFDDSETLKIDFPPQSERLFHFVAQYPTTGPRRMWAWIDGCEPQVDETDDDNNTLSQDLTVGIGDLQ